MISESRQKICLTFAKKTAIEAGKLLLKRVGKKNKISFKGRVNLVTEADLASEKLIVKAIKNKFPDHSILTEEKASVEKDSDFRWIIDPLDGTTNYAHGFPFWSVSIALEFKGKIIVGVVFDPLRNELFYARKNGGAFLNRKRLCVSNQRRLDKALLATGFPYDIRVSENDNLNFFNRFAKAARGVRRAGSAALDLCYLACGRFDGFWEQKLHPWDTAGGKIIVEEAGGKITNFNGKKYSIYDDYILGSNRKIHNQMIKVLSE
ncbi:MAG: inositol monophosphatase [candidate division Zixibacteria bacterium]|nr:inositol monophosphatase [candidate division Zixibacteria bacterium]